MNIQLCYVSLLIIVMLVLSEIILECHGISDIIEYIYSDGKKDVNLNISVDFNDTLSAKNKG